MSYLDPEIIFFRSLLEQMARDYGAKVNHPPHDPDRFPEFVKRGSGPSPGFVPRNEAWVELGPPTLSSASILLWTDNPALVKNNRVTVIGQDLPGLPAGAHPFAQVILAGGTHITEKNEPLIHQRSSLAGKIAGCMFRYSRERVWVRVKKEAIDEGLSFVLMGELIFHSLLRENSPIVAAEAVFISTDPEAVEEIAAFSQGIQDARREKLKERLKIIGDDLYECDNPTDCSECPDSPVCEIIKETVKIIKKRRKEFFQPPPGR